MYNFYLIIIRFFDPENIGVDKKISVSNWHRTIRSKDILQLSLVAILFLTSKKIPQGYQAGISRILTQEWSKMTNQP